MVLLGGVCLAVLQRNTGRKLSVEIGGSKRLQALSTLFSTLLLLPWVSLHLLTSLPPSPLSPLLLLPILLGLMQMAEFYVTTIASQRVDQAGISRLGSLLSFSLALAMATISWYWYHHGNNNAINVRDKEGEEHGLSVGVVMATVFFLVATATLTRPTPRSSSYSLVGYSSGGLPLYSTHRSSSHLSYSSLLPLVRDGVRKILDDGNSRKIFYFLLLNLVGVAYSAHWAWFMVSLFRTTSVSWWLRCCMECGPTAWG